MACLCPLAVFGFGPTRPPTLDLTGAWQDDAPFATCVPGLPPNNGGMTYSLDVQQDSLGFILGTGCHWSTTSICIQADGTHRPCYKTCCPYVGHVDTESGELYLKEANGTKASGRHVPGAMSPEPLSEHCGFDVMTGHARSLAGAVTLKLMKTNPTGSEALLVRATLTKRSAVPLEAIPTLAQVGYRT